MWRPNRQTEGGRMKPVVPEARPDARAVVYAKDQPEYKPLPANVQIPYTETKWALTWRELWYAFWRGVMYLTVMNFGGPPQPIHGSFAREEYIGKSIEPLWGEGAINVKPITAGMRPEPLPTPFPQTRSEERRVGEEGRSRGSPYH